MVGVLFAGPLVFAGGGFGLLSSSTLDWLSSWGSCYLFLLGAAVCAGRAVCSARDRGAWVAFTLAALCWTLANFYSAFAFYPAPAPVLSWSDAGYLAFPVFFSAGLLRYVHVRLPRVSVGAWLDAVIVALGAGAVIAALIFVGLTVHAESFSAVVTTLAYPVEDVTVVGLLVGAGSVLGWRLGTPGRLIAAAIVCITVSDVFTITAVLQGSAYGGAWTNAGWSAGIALLAMAAVVEIDAGPRRSGMTGRSAIAVPTLAAVAAMSVMILALPLDLSPIALGLACATVAAVIARLILSVREVESLADSRRLAMTDELTGLYNRRRLLGDLADACTGPTPHDLMLFDLDGFKQFNDFHGHSAGDELLASLAAALDASLPAGGRAYRLGGDEFCTLLPAESAQTPRRRSELSEGQVAALTASGRDWSIAPSWGSVRLGEEVSDPASALTLADRRMYEQKRRRPNTARYQVRDALLHALFEQQPTLRAHAQDVTDTVGRVARSLGMSNDEVDDAVRTAELHDIGKLAIPASVLDKPGPLNDEELAVIRTHTIVGERMLLAAPALQSVAPLVRASHERWDGNGYPDRLSGEAIPLAARIVSVCDAFDAMIAERPYRPARAPADALAELRRCAGTQFDPQIVDAFGELISS
jgi:two-component system cell cycle response regulator